jgi:hypothetical protein
MNKTGNQKEVPQAAMIKRVPGKSKSGSIPPLGKLISLNTKVQARKGLAQK